MLEINKKQQWALALLPENIQHKPMAGAYSTCKLYIIRLLKVQPLFFTCRSGIYMPTDHFYTCPFKKIHNYQKSSINQDSS